MERSMNEIDAFYQKQLEDFLRPHFESSDALTNFLSDVFDYENGSVTKRQMLYKVQKFVSLANNIEIISPNSDGLKILFLVICIDSLRPKKLNIDSFSPIFADYFSAEGKDYILSHFKLSYFEDNYRGLTFDAHHDITTLKEIMWLFIAIRNDLVHNGRGWSMQFFARDDDSIWLTSMETRKKVIEYKFYQSGGNMVKYHFDTTLNYEKFIFYFVEACISYISKMNAEC